MAGGLIQLLAWGSQNIKLNGNPSITFFKKVRKSHSNFSMESIRVNLNRTEANVYDTTIFRAKLGRHGDLVQQVYFVFELPDINRNDVGFRWVEHLGEAIINNYYITVGGSMIDRQYGEFLHLYNTLTLDGGKRAMYDRLIGNLPELIDPDGVQVYPSSTIAVPSRKIYIPLNFWFNKDSSLSLPMVCLQYSDTEIVIELRPLSQVYKTYGRAPNALNPRETLDTLINNYNSTWVKSRQLIDIKAYLEVNYYFVDTLEREQIAYNSHEYLVEQTVRIERFGLTQNYIFDMILQNPVKEFIWVLKRNDLARTNDWFDFLDYTAKHIMKNAKFIFNGMDRTDEKDASYYNNIQPYQHHTSNPRQGVYVYSFSLYPDDPTQPSGACNMSRIQRIQMMLEVLRPLTDGYKFDLTVYAINYNFLRISSGLAGIVFSS
jgi:hypothetical protein